MVGKLSSLITHDIREKTVAEARPYLIPFTVAAKQLELNPSKVPETITVSKEQLLSFLAVILKGVSFDENWYLAKYPDIAEAVVRGDFSGARAHFVEHGYIEGRASGPVIVDERFYMEQYPDIAESIEIGEIKSCQVHFDLYGQAEGRLPHSI